jgi:hypothetical protein
MAAEYVVCRVGIKAEHGAEGRRPRKGRMTTPNTGAGAVVPSGTLLDDLEIALDKIFSRKRERLITGGQVVGMKMWRTEFSGQEYGDVLDKVNALRDSIAANIRR